MVSLSTANVDWSRVDNLDFAFQQFPSRRSVVYGTKGVVSSSQPLATEVGLEILRRGGNAGTSTEVLTTLPLSRQAQRAKSINNRDVLYSGRSCRSLSGAECD